MVSSGADVELDRGKGKKKSCGVPKSGGLFSGRQLVADNTGAWW